ncbi:MAG TPA: MATE family efflux transporter [Fibrobacteria bacterium]|nr:MATE family efflux transporter [Fibrobacteria bacterium]HOX51127.1 MATE family efflux transporter [Fibrobacteria bacterium]
MAVASHETVSERSLFSLAWPVSVTLAVGIAQPAMDTFFLAQVSEEAASGVGALIPVFAALMILINTAGQAGSMVAGQFLGARRVRLAYATYAFLQAVMIGMGLVIGLVMVGFADTIAWIMGLSGEAAEHASMFLRVLGCGMGGRALWTSMINILASQGRTGWNLAASVVALAINAILNGLFLSDLLPWGGLGTYGVGLATILSWMFVSLGLMFVLSKRLGYHPRWIDVGLGRRNALYPLVRIGLPAMAEPISYQLFQVVLASQVTRLGDVGLKARVFAMTLANIAVVFSYGPGFAAQIVTAHLVGAGRENEVYRRLKHATAWACGGALVSACLVAYFSPWMLRGYTVNPVVIALGVKLLWIDAALQPAKAANIALTFSLRAAGDSLFPAVVGSGVMWTLGLMSALVFAYGFHWGVAGIWLGMALDEWVRSVLNTWRWKSGGWKGHGVGSAA